MVVTLGAMSMLLLSAAISIDVVTSDTPVGKSDLDRKRAYAAAESGLQVYVHKLLDDNAYWTKCSDAPNAVNNVWNGSGTDPRTWRNIREQSEDLIDDETPDGRRDAAAYTIETLPANGKPICLTSQPEDTRIDSRTGTFRVRVTGQSLNAAGQRVGPKRSIIASFKRRSFLDYIYFTDLEVLDPATYDSRYAGTEQTRLSSSNPMTVSQWGEEYCSSYAYQRHPRNNTLREDQSYRGQKWVPASGRTPAGWQSLTAECVEIQFAGNDAIRGPLHTNDKPLLCGRPKFGRDPDERIEVSAPSTNSGPSGSYRSACNGTEPYVNYDDQSVRYGDAGTWFYNEPLMQLPDSNSSLQSEAPPQYTFVGETTIRLNNGTINVTGTDATGLVSNNRSMSYPPNGVIYVKNAPTNCTKGYQVADPQDAISPGSRSGCGIAWVNGPYNTSLTIAAEDDIRINGHIDRNTANDPLLGLIAQNFIRVHHPVTDQRSCADDGRGSSNAIGSVTNLRVDAALLTLRHSFIVDNWGCGSGLGTLYVDGAISQRYRGPVATGSGSSTSSGYVKNYEYDNRLRFRSPPKFLDPVAASWRIQSYQEQVPAQ